MSSAQGAGIPIRQMLPKTEGGLRPARNVDAPHPRWSIETHLSTPLLKSSFISDYVGVVSEIALLSFSHLFLVLGIRVIS